MKILSLGSPSSYKILSEIFLLISLRFKNSHLYSILIKWREYTKYISATAFVNYKHCSSEAPTLEPKDQRNSLEVGLSNWK